MAATALDTPMTAGSNQPYWERVMHLTPRLKESVVISRHVYRNQVWYVLRNDLDKQSHRFTPEAYHIIAGMDGRKTVEQIWDNLTRKGGESAPTKDEFVLLLAKLHNTDLIQNDMLPSTAELIQKFSGQRAARVRQAVMNPLSIRISLFNPDRFLNRWSWVTDRLFTRTALIVWAIAVLCTLAGAAVHWPELSNSLSDRLLSTQNLLILWLTYPIVKLLHEFGHAFAVKKWGGEVNDMGILVLAMTPVPYVDATASGFFPEKHQRIAVAAMGMMVELALACIAFVVWLNAQTGLVSAVAYNVIFICGMSTILFNGNPLMRYDGYYILSDLIEIPNLGLRSRAYLGYLLKRYVFSIKTAQSPVTDPSEKKWFIVYGPLSFCHRILVLAGLIWLLSHRFFIIGVIFALWGTVNLLIIPGIKGVKTFIASPGMQERRLRLLSISAATFCTSLVLLFVFPLPVWTTAQGVVWLPEDSHIRAGADCEIKKILSATEQMVDKGQPLLSGTDPFLETHIKIYKARLAELFAGYNARPLHKRVERHLLLEEIKQVKGDLAQAEAQREKLTVHSPAKGKFILRNTRHLTGSFVNQGTILGYILKEEPPRVRTVVGQSDIGLVRQWVDRVEVRLAEAPGQIYRASIQRLFPAAVTHLPSAALGTKNGGQIPVDPMDEEGIKTLDTVFQVDLSLPGDARYAHVGQRVYVRFRHGTMPAAFQIYRSLRQLFLKNFYV